MDRDDWTVAVALGVAVVMFNLVLSVWVWL